MPRAYNPHKDFLYYNLRKAKGLVQLRKFMTPAQRDDFRAVLSGKARVVYNDDPQHPCVCGLFGRPGGNTGS
jgi:hypothetical protein